MTPRTTTYCTILSSNYLPKALALAESLRRHEDGARLKILFIDIAEDADLPVIEGVDCLSTRFLGLEERRILELVMGYDLVEFATAIKPVLFRRLLEAADTVVYLDPDTYLLTPLVELPAALAATEGGLLLTPHFLRPTPEGSELTDGHALCVGVYNLGFCAMDRRAGPFLDWWWGHLESECLFDPLSGLFVDQKWVDLGATLFQGGQLRHAGYNTGVGNLSERTVARDDEGYYVQETGDRVRLFHFHAFDPTEPLVLSQRLHGASKQPMDPDSPLAEVCLAYAERLHHYIETLPAPSPYPYQRDTKGRPISRLLRRAHRNDVSRGTDVVPSPFVVAEADEYETWRRRAKLSIARDLAADVAKSLRVILPGEYDRIQERFPRLAAGLRGRFAKGPGLWH